MFLGALRHCELSYDLRLLTCGSRFMPRSAAHVALLTEQYEAVVHKMLEDLDRPISELSLLDERLLSIARGRDAGVQDVPNLSTWLSRSLGQYPEAIAVISYEASGDVQCSYQELDEVRN